MPGASFVVPRTGGGPLGRRDDMSRQKSAPVVTADHAPAPDVPAPVASPTTSRSAAGAHAPIAPMIDTTIAAPTKGIAPAMTRCCFPSSPAAALRAFA